MALVRDDISLDEGSRALPTEMGVATASDNLSLSCDWHGCKNTKIFETLSKLNKHRNGHLKLYECLAQRCTKTFSQQQALDRHKQRIHEDSTNPELYYHCSVDGCKYASSGRKRFARADQAKEHIKDFGHYGPHSPSDRRRRAGNELAETHQIQACYEQWTLNENSPAHRSVEIVEFTSPRTKLWHTDDTANLYLRDSLDKLIGSEIIECEIPTCYYRLSPPGGLRATLFKTVQGLEEHRHRAHNFPRESFDFQSTSESVGTSSLAFIDSDLPFNLEGTMDWEKPINWDSSGHAPLHNDETLLDDNLNSEENTTVHESDWQDSIDDSSLYNNILHDSTSALRPGSIASSSERVCEFPRCGGFFTRRSDLRRHKATVHRVSTPLVCSICHRQFRRKDKLRDHLKKFHHLAMEPRSADLIRMYAEAPPNCIAPRNMMKECVHNEPNAHSSSSDRNPTSTGNFLPAGSIQPEQSSS